MKAILYIFTLLFTFSCTQPKDELQSEKGEELITYSQNLSIEDYGDYYKVKVIQPASSDSSFFTYILFRNKKNKPEVEADEYISIPVSKVICMSTSHLPPFTALEESQSLVGFTNTQHIYEKKL